MQAIPCTCGKLEQQLTLSLLPLPLLLLLLPQDRQARQLWPVPHPVLPSQLGRPRPSSAAVLLQSRLEGELQCLHPTGC